MKWPMVGVIGHELGEMDGPHIPLKKKVFLSREKNT